jgi:serine/threonine protein kinase
MRVGDVVAGRFALERKAGEGGMGTVFAARDLSAGGARVAVKSVRVDDVADRFAREAQVLEHIDHESVVRYVTHGSTEAGEAYLAMEWLEGEDLATRLARGPLSIGEALAVARGGTGSSTAT